MNELRDAGPSNHFIHLEAEVSLISSIDLACKAILKVEKQVDYLCTSPGGMPFQGAVCTYLPIARRRIKFSFPNRHKRRAGRMFCTVLLWKAAADLESVASCFKNLPILGFFLF
jgi:hypothetical protein